jgi:hypothetical protein
MLATSAEANKTRASAGISEKRLIVETIQRLASLRTISLRALYADEWNSDDAVFI